MSNPLVVDGKLTVPLFHGTSTLFRDSILETGLGGRNMVEELGLRTTASRLLELHSEAPQPDPMQFLDDDVLRKIATDPSTQNPVGHSGLNFRYGGTYVTPSRQAAARYALLNNCGSEALACILRQLDRLSSRIPGIHSRAEFSRIVAFAAQPRSPLLVEARDVPVALLRAEQGGSCRPFLEYIESVLGDPNYDTMIQQTNFELLGPILAFQLRLYKIIGPQSGHDSLKNLGLVPL